MENCFAIETCPIPAPSLYINTSLDFTIPFFSELKYSCGMYFSEEKSYFPIDIIFSAPILGIPLFILSIIPPFGLFPHSNSLIISLKHPTSHPSGIFSL